MSADRNWFGFGRLRYVSLFSGAGGLDLGLQAIGAQCVVAVEIDSDSCTTLRLNGHRNVWERRIETVRSEDIKALLGSSRLDLMVGGPPCQPFSKSAQWTSKAGRGLEDPRSSTLAEYIRLIRGVRPRAFLLENVGGFVYGGGLDAIRKSIDEINSSGSCYQLTHQIIDASQFGVAQKRNRFFAVAVDASEFSFPSARVEDERTVWDAIFRCNSDGFGYEEDLSVKGRWAELLPSIPPGENYLWHTDRKGGSNIFGWRTRFWSFLSKLHPDQHSPTIVASPSQNSGPFHWENRLLTTTELAAIQGFPLGYQFHGSRSSRHRQIGNAVPPQVASAIGGAISAHLGIPTLGSDELKIPRANCRPRLPVLSTVPPAFLGLVGEHPAHPGTGKGPRPRAP